MTKRKPKGLKAKEAEESVAARVFEIERRVAQLYRIMTTQREHVDLSETVAGLFSKLENYEALVLDNARTVARQEFIFRYEALLSRVEFLERLSAWRRFKRWLHRAIGS